MRAVAVKVLHQDVRRVRLERYAIVPVDDDRIPDDDVVRSVSVPWSNPYEKSKSAILALAAVRLTGGPPRGTERNLDNSHPSVLAALALLLLIDLTNMLLNSTVTVMKRTQALSHQHDTV